MTKPEFVTDTHLEYLDDLRESGITNMFGAAPYVHKMFPELDEKQSREVVTYWMESFAERHPA